jgi:hypothetical protein
MRSLLTPQGNQDNNTIYWWYRQQMLFVNDTPGVVVLGVSTMNVKLDHKNKKPRHIAENP